MKEILKSFTFIIVLLIIMIGITLGSYAFREESKNPQTEEVIIDIEEMREKIEQTPIKEMLLNNQN